jgi:hypothetical protein
MSREGGATPEQLALLRWVVEWGPPQESEHIRGILTAGFLLCAEVPNLPEHERAARYEKLLAAVRSEAPFLLPNFPDQYCDGIDPELLEGAAVLLPLYRQLFPATTH